MIATGTGCELLWPPWPPIYLTAAQRPVKNTHIVGKPGANSRWDSGSG